MRIDDQELVRLSQLVHMRVIGNGPRVAEERLHAAMQDHDERHSRSDLIATRGIDPVRPVAGGMPTRVPLFP